MTPITVGIFVYPGVEDLDFVGPLETFHVAGHRAANRLGQETSIFTVFTVAEQPDALTTSSGMVVQPKHTFADHPAIDVIVLPGGDASGQSTRREVLDWLKTVTQTTRVTASVCTGVYLLAELGLLDGKPATTHWSALDNLAERYPAVSVQRDVRWVEVGNVISSAGISAGMDMSLQVVRTLCGEQIARDTADYLEYRWHDDPHSPRPRPE